MSDQSNIKGLKGEVFDAAGRIGCAIPPAGLPGAIPWEITYVYSSGIENSGVPWADAKVGNILIRINPDIIQEPFHRLADCLWFAHKYHDNIPVNAATGEGQAVQETMPPPPHPEAKTFVFWRMLLASSLDVTFIDTNDRIDFFARGETYRLTPGLQRVGRFKQWEN